MTNKLNKISPFLLLFIIVILGYWQVSFFAYGLKWDLIDVVFPFRYHFSECIQSGYFPFWNPYQQTGTPFFLDLQAPTYYPELLFTSIFTGYSVFTMHLLYIFYVAVAGIGMYKLSFHFNTNKHASLIAGIAYAFCGYFVGHGQHFFLLVGAAWLPFTIVNYIRLNENKKPIDVLKTSFFLFLMVTGSYQALSFTLLYLLAFIFLYYFTKSLSSRNKKNTIALLRANLLMSVIVVVLLLPLIVSTLEVLDSVSRLEDGISLEKTCKHGQSLKAIITFILPFCSQKYPEFFGNVDTSMRNHYIGLIPLVFFMLSLLRKRTALEYILLAFGAIIMAASFSPLPVREFLFRYVPFMNMFLYAAFIRIFGLMAIILFATNEIAFFLRNPEINKKKVLIAASMLFGVLFFLFVYSITKVSFDGFIELLKTKNIYTVLKGLTFYQHIFFEAPVQMFFVAVLFLLVTKHVNHKNFKPLFVLLIVTDILFATQLNMSSTVIDAYAKPSQMNKNLSLYPKGFPIPVDNKINLNDQQHVSFTPFWRNTYIFSKQVTFGGFTSFELKSQSKIDDEFTKLRNTILNNHLFYFSDSIASLKNFSNDSIRPDFDSKLLFFKDSIYAKLSNKSAKTDSSDNIIIKEFTPTKFIVETETNNAQFLTLLQSNFKGWKTYIDNNETPVFTSNFNYRSVYLPSGKHRVIYEYNNPKIVVLYVVSNILFFALLLFLIWNLMRSRNVSKKHIWFFIISITILCSVFLVKRLTHKTKNQTTTELYNQRWPNQASLQHFEPVYVDSLYIDSLYNNKNGETFEVKANQEFLKLVEIKNENKKYRNITAVVRFKAKSNNYSNVLIFTESVGKSKNGWHATRTDKQIEQLNQWNDVIYYRNFYKLKENDLIRIFIWNPSKENMLIKDLRVDFYPF